MKTAIRVSKEILKKLKAMKTDRKDTYEDIIWDLLEDRMELSEKTKRDIAQARKEMAEGKTISLEALKKKYDLK